MPVKRHYFSRFGLNLVRVSEPFHPDDLFAKALEDLTDNVPIDVLAKPLIVDLRAVNLMKFPPEDFKNLARRRATLLFKLPSGPCAYLTSGKGSFAMLRMFTIYADLSGVRREQLTIVTTDIVDAVAWIFPKLKETAGTEAQLLEEVM